MSSARQQQSQESLMKRQPQKRDSRLLEGVSLPAQLTNSSFGKFQECLRELQSTLGSLEFKLPRIIVVGGRSAGKSSLLEAITKCPVFPRHADFCTKMPVKLQLKQVTTAAQCEVHIKYKGKSSTLQTKDDILTRVAEIMEGVKGVSLHELTVEICQVDVPTFELVDLPGIQTFPEERFKMTSKLVSQYLVDEETLVLCALDATMPALDSSSALRLIRSAGKLNKTIIALTKSDLVTSDLCVVNQLFARVLGCSSDHQHLKGLAGCVAVANRDHRDHVSLVDSDAAERQVFEKLLQDPAPAYAPYAAPAMQQRLRQNMTKQQLIVQLDAMFHKHIVEHWKPRALACLQSAIDSSLAASLDLGIPPTELDKDKVIQTLLDKVDYEGLCKALCDKLPFTASRPPQGGPALFAHGPSEQIQPFTDHGKSQYLWGTLPWAGNIIYLRRELTARVTAALESKVCLEPLCSAIDAVFTANEPPLRLKRLSTLHQHVREVILPACVATGMAAAKADVHQALREGLLQLYGEHHGGAPRDFTKLQSCINGSVMSHLLEAVNHAAFNLPAAFKLEESVEVQSQRAALKESLLKLRNAHDRISKIEEALNVSPTPSNSLAASDPAPSTGIAAGAPSPAIGDTPAMQKLETILSKKKQPATSQEPTKGSQAQLGGQAVDQLADKQELVQQSSSSLSASPVFLL